MNNSIPTNIVRFIIVFLAQIWIFKHITFSFGGFVFIHFLIYPMAVLLLPIKFSRSVALILAFILGIFIDMSYDSVGVHTGALVFTAYIRNIIIAFLEPYEGYNIDDVPTIKNLGIGWFVSFLSISLLIHTFLYFSLEAFSFVFIFEIFLNTISSFIVSFIVILISQFIFRTKY